MISVGLVFVALAGISFLGFAINALFGRLKITNIVPLMLIGILIGPVFGIVGTSSTGIIAQLTPFVTAIAIAFILFDVGLNMNLNNLSKVAARGTAFTFGIQLVNAFAISGLAYFLLHWDPMIALIFGFAISGPSSIVVQSIVKVLGVSDTVKTTLLYEGVVTDALALIVPLLLLNLIMSGNASYAYGLTLAFTVIVGAAVLGAVSALFWLYVLTKFKRYSHNYGWMLTITMLIATYGMADILGLNVTIAIFVFGLTFATLGTLKGKPAEKGQARRMFSFDINMRYIKSYQREIVFFTATFFFVYIGLLFDLSGLGIWTAVFAGAITGAVLGIRYAMTPIIGAYLSKDPKKRSSERWTASFSMGRGLSAAVVAAVPITMGISLPGFLDIIFLVILFTNIVSTIGVFVESKKAEGFQSTLKGAVKG